MSTSFFILGSTLAFQLGAVIAQAIFAGACSISTVALCLALVAGSYAALEASALCARTS